MSDHLKLKLATALESVSELRSRVWQMERLVDAIGKDRDDALAKLRAASYEPERIALLVSQVIGAHMEPPDSSGCESGDDAEVLAAQVDLAIVLVTHRAEDAEAERDDAREKLRALVEAASALCRDAANRGELKDEMRDSWDACFNAIAAARGVL